MAGESAGSACLCTQAAAAAPGCPTVRVTLQGKVCISPKQPATLALGTFRWSLEATAGASALVLVCAKPAQLAGTSLTWEKVCASSWQEVFLCLNEHLGMSTFLQGSLLFSLPVYFNVSVLCSTTSPRGSGCFTKGWKYYPCRETGIQH